MIIYLAGSPAKKAEESERLAQEDNTQWGVLLSFKDIKTKDNKGSKRFKDIYTRNVTHNQKFPKRTRLNKSLPG